MKNIHSNYIYVYEKKPMGAVSAFPTGNSQRKPLMTDVNVIHTTDVKSTCCFLYGASYNRELTVTIGN